MNEIRIRLQRPSNGVTDANHARSRDPERNLLCCQRAEVLAHPGSGYRAPGSQPDLVRVRRRRSSPSTRTSSSHEQRRGAVRELSSAPMLEVLPGVFHWTTLHPRIHIDVSSYWLDRVGVVIDPLVPSDDGLEWFAGRANRPRAVLLSNRHHYRDSDRFAEGFEPATPCPVASWPARLEASVPTRPRSICPNSTPSPSPTASSAVDVEAHPGWFPTA
jgi:hypothetical protein